MKNSEQNLKDLWDSINQTNICIVEVSEEQEKGAEIFEKIMSENFPNLMKGINTSI